VLTALGLAGAAGAAISTAGPLTPAGWAVIGAGTAVATDVAVSVVPRTRTELVLHASILSGDRVVMKGREVLYVSANDIPLYVGSGSPLPQLSSPGSSLLGPPRPLTYAR
jgi:hypothetical protein